MSGKTVKRPPQHLRVPTRQWWSSVLAEYDLEPHHERLLTLAAEAWDRAAEAREVIADEGPYFTDRFGSPKAHPALAVERDARTQFARLLRELALDGEALPDPRIPRAR